MTTRDPHDALTQEETDQANIAATEKLKRQQQIDDIKWLMAHPSGRRIVCRLLEESGTFRTSFHSSGSIMALNEGRKQLGYFLTGELLEIVPDGYLKLLKEYRFDS
jgi:hypothetical protein